ncbi:MAG: hypothetical protein AB7I18_04080 [Candidatus Berkiella sp.]
MMIIESVLNTPTTPQFRVREIFMDLLCSASFANRRSLWSGTMLATLEEGQDGGFLLESVVHKDIEQANSKINYKVTLKSRDLIQLVAPDVNPEHFKRRVVATSEKHPGMGHPVSYTDEGMKLLRIEEDELVPLTPWECFLADHEDELLDNNGSWHFFDAIREAWHQSPLNTGINLLTNVDWHLPTKPQVTDTINDLEAILVALDLEQVAILNAHGRTRDPKIPTPANSPEPEKSQQVYKPN